MASASQSATVSESPAESAKFTPTHEQIAALAYALWHERGCPDGSPEVDWLKAEAALTAAEPT